MQRNKRFNYEVIKELNFNNPIEGLWEKALTDSGGNETLAKALYLRYRSAQLAKIERNRVKAGTPSAAPKLVVARTSVTEKLRHPFRTFLYLLGIALFIVAVLLQIIGL